MGIFLTDEEMMILTGKKYKKCQIKALDKLGIPYVINAAGRAVVSVNAINNHPYLGVLVGNPQAMPLHGGVWRSNKVKEY